jgi:uncharacterized cupredoxin-like copper-binding protein
VVTNALRLRAFKRPQTVRAILHPSLRERVSEYAYLVAIALVALAIGAAALYLARGSTGAPSALMSAAVADTHPVSRTIAVTTTDGLRFSPAQVGVKAGETVAFDVTNSGALLHEFFVGTPAEQQAHEAEMATGSPMMEEPNAVNVPAGRTVRLVYTFDRPGTLEYGCHVPGHYAAGMRGTITIT